MELRYAELHDLKGIYKLVCELENKEIPFKEFESIYCENIDNDNIHYLVIQNTNRQLIGFGSLHIQKLLHHSNCVAEIQELIVSESYKGQGIGAKLFEKLKSISESNGCEVIEVCCNRKRVKSHLFYEKCGFSKSHFKFTQKLGN